MSLTKEETDFAMWLAILDHESKASTELKEQAVRHIAQGWMESRCAEDALAKRVQAQAIRIETLEAELPRERQSAPVLRLVRNPHPGFEKCFDCGALIRDRGEVVGRHLFDCPTRLVEHNGGRPEGA